MFSYQKHVRVVTIQLFLKLHQLVINCCFMTSIVVTGERVSLFTCELQLALRLPQHKSRMYHGTTEGVSMSEGLRKHLPRFPQTSELLFPAVFETYSVYSLRLFDPGAHRYHHLAHFYLGSLPDTLGTSCEPPTHPLKKDRRQ